MASDDIKSTITGWCTTEDSLQFVEDLSEPGTDFALTLRSGSAVSGTIPITVSLPSGSDRLTVSSTAASSDESIARTRPALVQTDGSTVTGAVYLDGFNRNAFMQVVAEVAKTTQLLGGAGAAAEATPTPSTFETPTGAGWSERSTDTAAAATTGDAWAPQAAQSSTLPGGTDSGAVTPGGGALPTPSFGGAASTASTGYSPLSGQQAAAPAQPAAQAAFAPTHAVPPQGMQAWAAPDPNGAVVATLGGGLPIQVTEVRGAWARVLCSNGWTGWVDGRIIGVAR